MGSCEHYGNYREIFRHIIGDAERRHCSAGHEQLFSEHDHLDDLGRVRLQVYHVGSLLGCLSSRIHRQTHISYGQRGCVVGAVPDHSYDSGLSLLSRHNVVLVFRLRFGPVLVNPHFGGNALRRQGLVTSQHDRPNSHHLDRQNLLPDTRLQNILEPDNSDNLPVPRHSQRRISLARDPIH